MPDLVSLPTIDDLRAQLYRDPYIQAVEAICPHTVKQLPLRIINSSIDATYQHLRSIVDGSPGASLSATLHQLWSQSTALTPSCYLASDQRSVLTIMTVPFDC